MDEFNLDTPGELESENDPDKNVKDWLTSSQNHFSAQIQNSDTFSQDLKHPHILEISASNILIHTETKKVASPPKIVHVPPPQHDWDKIEPILDLEETTKKKENIVGPMDIEPFFVDDSEYTMDHPRRSSRNRDSKIDDSILKMQDSSGENEKKSQKVKQTWNNVKRMRKEFSKLNKKNRSKLNVSIEMVKKTQNLKPNLNKPVVTEQAYNIDDNTPVYTNKENEIININSSEPIGNNEVESANPDLVVNPLQNESINNTNFIEKPVQELQKIVISKESLHEKNSNINTNEENVIKPQYSENSNKTEIPEPTKMPFIRKSALNPRKPENLPEYTSTCNSEQPMPSANSDDIEISIKIGNTTTNIVIKKKHSDVQVKINTDREVQTSLGPHNLDQNKESSLKDGPTPNIDINIESIGRKDQNPVVNINKSINTQKADSNLDKSTSGKKNTASADTGTAQFEITESVEKELSNIMECERNEETEESQTKVNSPVKQQVEVQNADKVVEQIEHMDDLNDLDIFNSGSVKEANIQLLKEHAPSEILVSTIRSKFKTQKIVEKRERDNNDEDILPKYKKMKITQEEKSIGQDKHTDSEPMNYDALMGQVFANIDADMEEIRKSQEIDSVSILKDKGNSKNNEISAKNTIKSTQIKKTQIIKNVESQINTEITPNLNEYFNEKHSENVFSILDKEDEIPESVKMNKVSILLTAVIA